MLLSYRLAQSLLLLSCCFYYLLAFFYLDFLFYGMSVC